MSFQTTGLESNKPLESEVRHSIFRITTRFWIFSAFYFFLICDGGFYLVQKFVPIPKQFEISFLTFNLILIAPGFLLAHWSEGVILERRREAFLRTMSFIKNRMEYRMVEVEAPSFFARLFPRVWRRASSSKRSVRVECYTNMDRRFDARLYRTSIEGFFPVKYVVVPAHAFQELQRQGRAHMEAPQRMLSPSLKTISHGKIRGGGSQKDD